MRTIAILNQKGGVGKTTSVANLAAALSLKGQKVIVVDLDPQAHLTIHLGADTAGGIKGSYEVLIKSASLVESLINVRQNLWLLSANIDLVGAESELVSVVGREIILREAIDTVKSDFDYLLIDCPPSLGLLSLNALAAAQEVLIPIQPHFLALQGFGQLLQTISLVNKRINPDLKVSAILLCMFDTRASLSAEVQSDIERFLGNARDTDCPWSQAQVVPVHIRRNIKLAEAPSYGKTIFEYEPNCHGSQDYTSVAEYIHAQVIPSSKPAVTIESDNNTWDISKDQERSATIARETPTYKSPEENIPIQQMPALESSKKTLEQEPSSPDQASQTHEQTQ